MDSAKSNVVKSKSSTSKSAAGSKNKKSWSNAEFQRQALKKRGVYVEKKTTKLDINQEDVTDTSPQRQKPPPRPKRGQKRFLTSVLTILDKDTIGTQCPDFQDPKKSKRPSRKRRSPSKNSVAVHTSTQQVDVVERKKPKFRSKVLTSEIHNQDDNLYIISPKRDITSTNSERSYVTDSRKYLDLPQAKGEDAVREIAKHIYSDVAETIAKEVLEESKTKKRVFRIDEPKTLVEERQEDRGLYNFFVDLLESTFSVYNVHAEYKKAHNEQFDPKLEIDENVAEKLQIKEAEKPPEEGRYYFVKDDGILSWKSKFSETRSRSPPTSSRMKEERRVKSPKRSPRRRFRNDTLYSHQYRTNSPKTESPVPSKKSFRRSKRKNNLLNILKEELMQDVSYEEPQNLHQALRLIARNKRRNRQTIRFDETATKSGDDSHVCRFKRRKVISASTKQAKNKSVVETRTIPTTALNRQPTAVNYSRKAATEYCTTGDEFENYETDSYHSLEVQEFEELAPKKHMFNPEPIMYAYHHSTKDSEDALHLLKFTNSLDSSKNYCSANSDSVDDTTDARSVCLPWEEPRGNKKPYCASMDFSNLSNF